MKSQILPGAEVKVRLQTYKSFRHYGGREIKTKSHICKAIFIELQSDHTFLVELTEDYPELLRKQGCKIAVIELHFNV